jgi:putative MFS transporter
LLTWRILWFFGLPTGLAIVVLNRWIPESPRFLFERGEDEAARGVMRRFGIQLEANAVPSRSTEDDAVPAPRGFAALFRRGLGHHSSAVMLYGLGWGIVNWGFVTFLPTILRDVGMKASASALLFDAALVSIPGTVLVAWLYGKWSSRLSMIGFALLTAISLSAFALIGNDLTHATPAVIVMLTAVLMLSSTAVVSMLSPYAAEVYPTELRGTGSGLAAASSKLGGMIGPPLVGTLLTGVGGIAVPALVTALPIGVAAIAMIFLGEETRDRALEQISTVSPAETAGSSS